VIGLTGCTRHFFRQRADEEVDATLAEKDKYADWKIEQFHVYPDPRARFADCSNPDRPPMPPDDPAARDLSPNPQKPGHAGVARLEGEGYVKLLAQWDAENRAESAAAKTKQSGNDLGAPPEEVAAAQPKEKVNPDNPTQPTNKESSYATTILIKAPKPGDPRPYLLKLEQACELAQINSREYQDQRENLYLAALPVTLERFSFAAQFFAAEQVVRQWAGENVTSVPANQKNSWFSNSNVGFSKLFSTGALLLANFANQTVLNLSGPGKPVTSQSTINLNLVQPFLQGGGKAVTLEPLTQAERNLVYEIRNYARFRKELYVAIAGGGGGSITGANFQPTGVISSSSFNPSVGSSGTVPGVIPGVPITGNPGLLVSPGASGQVPLTTALAAPVSGYLSTLLEDAQIQVDHYNIDKLESFFKLAKALQEGGDISQLQTDTFEQSLLGARQNLINDQQDYLQAIDQFKLQLGIPPHLLIELDDTPFRPLNEQFRRYEDTFRDFKVASEAPFNFRAAEVAPRLRAELRKILTNSNLVRGTEFARKIEGRLSSWDKLTDDELQKRLAKLREDRRALEALQDAQQEKGQELSPADKQRLQEANDEIDLGEFEDVLRRYEKQPWKAVANANAAQRQQQLLHNEVANAFILIVVQARNERMRQLHKLWPELDKVCVSGVNLMEGDLNEAATAAVQVALASRLDLMNVRGQVVDAWRQLAVYANALLAPLTVQYNLSASTPAGAAQPFHFSANNTQQQLMLNTQLPLVRTEQRNNYRAALINYQRARRILQRAEDEVAFDVRQELIILRQFLELYRIQTRQVELGYLTVENSLDTLQAPNPPVGAGQTAPDTATRAASLTAQLISAQSNLYRAHFNMTTYWITYLNERDQLYRDMELMPLDPRGVWIDDTATCQCPASAGGTGPQGQADAPLPAPRPIPDAGGQGAAPAP
jgi:hypothetical protein